MSNENFGFPFKPYDVQLKFMESLTTVLESGQIGIFESPTGTGKSLSLLCGTLTWLRKHQRRNREELEIKAAYKPEKCSADDWLMEQSHGKQLSDEAAAAKRKLSKLDQQLKRRDDWEKRRRKRRRNEDDDEEEIRKLLKSVQKNLNADSLKTEESTDDLIVDYESDDAESEFNEEEDEDDDSTRIYYCSRTHSQLAQFVQEVKRSSFGKDIRLVSLASRESLCINETVRGLRSLSLMNERCLDMQKNKGKLQSCQFKKEQNVEDLREAVLSDVQDIEELANNARRVKACPYYASRMAASEAEIIIVPYNSLLHAGTREASGLKLQNSIVIIDEAHNLMETIVNIHSVCVGGQQVSRACIQLDQYYCRYKSRFSPQNLLYVKQILYVLNAFVKHLAKASGEDQKEKVLTPIDFLSEIGVDNINLFKLIRYCDKSRIARKLHGFAGQNGNLITQVKKPVQSKLTNFLQKLEVQPEDVENVEPPKEGSPFMLVQEFLRTLTTANEDGRVVCKSSANLNEASLKFLLLNPAAHFKEIVSQARAVILAGGTMHPHSEFVDRLLVPCRVLTDRIHKFSCGHVIPKENLLALALSKGPSGKDLDFTYGARAKTELIEEAGRLILNLCTLVPGGMVVFFPSYDYEQLVYSTWERTGLILRLSGRKRIFREPKRTSQLESVLANFSKSVSAPKTLNSPQNGAILLSVVGGKMSEGINFSDDLGRCIVMIGLPFPNIHSLEFKEKASYLERHQGPASKNAYGETLCMRAVNQSIGRAIRHQGDYAVVALLDLRYQKPTVQASLPAWMRESLQSPSQFGPALSSVKQFFTFHKTAQMKE